MKPASLTAKDLAYPLDSLALDDLTLAGGKASKLSSLKRAGFPVPDGFVLTTEAYQAFVEYNALSAAIAAHMASVSPEKPETAEAATQAIRSQLSQGRIPDEVVAAVQNIYQHMHPGVSAPPVAVRSSATAEDLAEASFAGQHESFLNVRSEAALLEALKGCWASLWTARAIAYRARQQINPLQVRMAVILQVMAPAESAGVLFTINPLTANKGEMLINATWGLGESLVSGQVAPDTITLDKETGEVKASALGAKQVMSVLATQGTELIETLAAQRQAAVVSPAQIETLADLGRGVEAYFATAQDIEWAIAGDEVYLLQARPVTAVGRLRVILPQSQLSIPGDDRWLPEEQFVAQPFDLWTRANFGEVLPNPLSPLTLSGFQLVGEKMASNDKKDSEPNIEMTRRIYGRLYANEGGMRHAVAAIGLPTALLNTLWGSRRPDLGPQSGFRPFRLLSKIPGIFKGMGQTQQQSQAGLTEPLPPKDDALYSRIDQWLAAFQDRDLQAYSDADLWQEARNVWEERRSKMFQRHALVSQKAFFMFIPLERVTGWWAGDTKLAQRLITGISGVHAAEIGPQLWRIAQRAQELGVAHLITENAPNAALFHLETTPQARPVVEQLALFLSEHGHRCPAEAEILLPRWAEAPGYVVELIAGYLRAGDGVNPVAAETAQRAMRETTQAEIEGRLDPLRRRLFRFLLTQAGNAIRQRDNSRHYLAKIDLPRRRLYTELGRRWAERGWLKTAEDIFFLLHREIEAVVAAHDPAALHAPLQTLVAERRKAYDFWCMVIPPEALDAKGRPLADPVPPGAISDDTVLQGIPASGGLAQGVARLVQDPRDAARLQPGDILVTRSTDPGWTPVFPLVSGLVLEMGGQLSHGAIVAREYGVPAVVNVYGALSRISDGTLITVDGTQGLVYLPASGEG